MADDFDDFCSQASKLAEESNGAPLFTVTQSRSFSKQVTSNDVSGDNTGFQEEDFPVMDCGNDTVTNEDDWPLLYMGLPDYDLDSKYRSKICCLILMGLIATASLVDPWHGDSTLQTLFNSLIESLDISRKY